MDTQIKAYYLNTGGVRVYVSDLVTGMQAVAEDLANYVKNQVEIARAVTFDASALLCIDIRLDTPKKTGRAAAHWQLTTLRGATDYEPGRRDPKQILVRNEMMEAFIATEMEQAGLGRPPVGQFKVYGPAPAPATPFTEGYFRKAVDVKFGPRTLFIENPAPYIRELEEGSSVQAPAGMVRVNTINWPQYINAAIKRFMSSGVDRTATARGALISAIKHNYLHGYDRLFQGIPYVTSGNVQLAAIRGRKKTGGYARYLSTNEQFFNLLAARERRSRRGR